MARFDLGAEGDECEQSAEPLRLPVLMILARSPENALEDFLGIARFFTSTFEEAIPSDLLTCVKPVDDGPGCCGKGKLGSFSFSKTEAFERRHKDTI
jgi:hypothetical protein